LTEIRHKLTLQAAYRPYIECPPIRGNAARCFPRFLLLYMTDTDIPSVDLLRPILASNYFESWGRKT